VTLAGLALIALLWQPASASTDSVTIARLQYEGGGDWYANPSSLPNLLEAVRERTGIPTARREAVVRPLDPNLREYPYLYLTGHGDIRLSPAERVALRSYLLAGGFLHADDNYGLDESFRDEVAALFPDRELVEIPPDHPVFHTLYPFPEGIPKVHEHDGAVRRRWGSSTRDGSSSSTASRATWGTVGRIRTCIRTMRRSVRRRFGWV
jgi:hypothetical protein